jgi:hypothetical protein
MRERPMPEEFMIDFTATAIEKLMVNRSPDPSVVLRAVMVVRSDEGERVTIGWTREALEELTRALIEISPRTPGTPGWN